MKTDPLPRDRALSQAAERQMRSWALQLESQQSLHRQKAASPLQKVIHPFVAISREAGADGGRLARLVAEKLGWKAFDRELLDYMAEHFNLPRITLEFVDETVSSWFHEMFGTWLDEQMVSQAEYVSRLGRVVLLAAQHESTVFVGRGAQYILPRERGLVVRIIAPRKMRIDRLVERRQCSRQEAERYADEIDAGRVGFVRRYFHKDPVDPHQYDLMINLERTSLDEAAELLAAECRRRFGLKS
jgi:cytidylate kinase